MYRLTGQKIPHTALVALMALDLLGLVALFSDQLFSVQGPVLWLLSAVAVLAALPLLLRLADWAVVPSHKGQIIPSSGEKIP